MTASNPTGHPRHSRREFIKTAAAAALGAGIIGCKSRKSKPNLLFIWTDEQRADTMRAYGNAKIKVPNLNKLASESVVFQNAYVSQPVCTPSRSTVLTGQWPHCNSCVENNVPLPLDVPCLPELVADPEYHTGYYGKWHLGDEVFAQHGFDEWISIEDAYTRFYRDGRDRSKKSDYWHHLQALGYEPDTQNGTYSRGFAAGLPLEHCKPKFLEEKACQFLRSNRDRPFMLNVNFLEPHMPFYGPLDNSHDLAEIDLPANFDDELEDNEPMRYRLLRERYRRNGFGRHELDSEAGWRRLITNYWGLVSQVDLSVGGILNTLENLGLADNTIVVYTSDHGDMMGSHRLLAKSVMYEEAVKVPWLIRAPGMGRQQTTIHNRVSQIDLVPTLLDLMGAPSAPDLPGHSLRPLIEGGEATEDHVFIEWNPSTVGNISPTSNITPHSLDSVSREEVRRLDITSTRTVIAPDGWKLSLSDNDSCQLFNLGNDPLEETNLYDTGKFDAVIARLSNRIADWQERTGDKVSL